MNSAGRTNSHKREKRRDPAFARRSGDQQIAGVSGARRDTTRRANPEHRHVMKRYSTDPWHVQLENLNGGYRLPRASCGNGQYTPPTSNSLKPLARALGSRLLHGRTVYPQARPGCPALRSTRTRYGSSS